MKELDMLLETYLNHHFIRTISSEQQAFISLLKLPDPLLMAYIVGKSLPETEEQRRVIDTLRRNSRD
jgi:succinate dehydrogenase flavin-adding protein (antitoxin of CptAB toxin-antitoxin module)